MQLFLENFWAGALSILETEIIERQQLEVALQKLQEETQQKQTQLEQAQKELQRVEAQVIQTQYMYSLKIAGAVQEITNPLSFIDSNIGYVKTYTQDLLNIMHLYAKHYPQPAAEIQSAIEEVDLDFLIEDLQKLLSSMQIGTERIHDVIHSLRNFSRLDKAQESD